jgi:hypothetical protein
VEGSSLGGDNMSYMEAFLKAYGQECTIQRTPTVTAHVSMRRSTKAIRDLSARDAYFEGIIEESSALVSGDIFSVDGTKYLVQSVFEDYSFGEYSFFAVKTNAVITYKEKSSSVDSDNNVTYSWSDVEEDQDVFMSIVTAQMKVYDTGLLEGTRYRCQIPKTVSVKLNERIVYNGDNYQVTSIDDSGLEGVDIVQLAADIRPD